MSRSRIQPVLLALVVVVVDLLTKRHAAIHFADGDAILIPGFLRLTFVENPGAAFGVFQGSGPIIGLAAILITVVVLGLLGRDRPILERTAFGLIIGGAVGNIVDRIFRGDGFLDGPVIDWIALWRIPTFNVADTAVNAAVALLLIHAWRTRNPEATASTS